MSRLKVGINGLGRIGRLVMRYGFDSLDIVAVNGRSSSEMMAHLLQYDSVHGVWDKKVEARDKEIIIDGKSIPYFQSSGPQDTKWDVDVVIECTGIFKSQKDLQPYLDNGARLVLVSAPTPDPDLTLVYGVNHANFQKDKHKIVSNASCTTNCLAPLIKAVESLEIERAFMTTVHSYTNDQKILDSSHQKDLRRARTAALNMIPTSTGAASAIGSIFPNLKGKIQGMAVRVPVANVSLIDCVIETRKQIKKEDLNQLLKSQADGPLKGVLGFEEKALVSSDFIGRKESSVVDALSTDVLDQNLIKILAWYDNEAGFSQRLIDFIQYLEKNNY